MTISDLQQRLERISARLDSEIEAQAAIAGNDLVALIIQRVVQTGKSADGAQFTPYSDIPVPAFFYYGRSRNAGGEAKVRAAGKKKKPISYKEFRAINNLNTTPKNFEFTGSMWRGFGVLQARRTPTGATVTIGGRNPDSENKIGWNTEQEGESIIKPSKQEIAIVQANLQRWAQNVVNG